MYDTRLLVKKLKDKKLKLALAESVTGGIASQRITNCKGASDMFAGSIICYTPEVKMSLLGIKKRTIIQFTPESKQVTAAMAKGLARKIQADVYAAVTGLASEGGSEQANKPVGTVFFAILYKGKIHHYRLMFNGSPLEIREAASARLLEMIEEVVS